MDQWISVDDRLPTGDDSILVFDPSLGVTLGWPPGADGIWLLAENPDEFAVEQRGLSFNVTHWMPRPEPPCGN